MAPLKTTVGDIGSIVMPADWGRDDPAERRALERAVTIMAGSAAESCQGQVDLSKRVHELDALFRLSSLLVRATEPDAVLEAALELALSVLRADAGSISVLDDPGNPQGPLVHRVSRGLSEQWLSTATPISVDGELRSRALCGEIVQVPDLQSDPRIAEPFRQMPLEAPPLWPLYDRIPCPTWVVRGAESDLLSDATADEMTRRGPRAHRVDVAGVGHAPTFIPDDQIAIVERFLAAPA